MFGSRRHLARWALLAAALLCAPLAGAGEYTLTEERIPQRPLQSFTLCDDLEENLNRFRDAPPMACGIEVHPQMEQFAQPDWEPLEPREHMDILRVIARARDEHLSKEKQQKNWQINKEVIESGKARLWRSRIDISNSGREVTVLRHDLWGCSPDKELSFGGGRVPGLAVLSEDGDRLHEDYASLHTGSRSYINVFFHEGRTYASRWWGGLNFENGRLAVYDTYEVQGRFGYDHRALCTITYTPDSAQQ